MTRKARSKKTDRPRLVVYITPQENTAVLADAHAMGLKNGHAWARMKLAKPLREVIEQDFSKNRS